MPRVYSRIHRLLRLLTLIQSGGEWNARRLAQECDTTERTIYRDLKMLEGAGVPCFHDGETGGYRIRPGFFMPPVELTLEEALAIVCLGEHVGAREQIPFVRAAGSAIAKLRSQLPAAIQDRLSEFTPHVEMRLASVLPADGVTDVYEVLRKAIATRRALKCRYESARSRAVNSGATDGGAEEFILKPYSLLFNQRAWYVVGYHSGRSEVRSLKLNRFTEIELTRTPYEIPADFSIKRHLGQAWRMIRGERIYSIELDFAAAFAENIADTHWHETQQIEWHEDGSITFRCEVAGLDEIVWWILGMGPHCVVRQPVELVRLVRELTARTAATYGKRSLHPSRLVRARRPSRVAVQRH